MTQLRHEFISTLRIRNYAPNTIKRYTHCLSQYARYFGKSPSELGPKEVKQYLVYLIEEKQSSWSEYRQVICALRFLYTKVLGHEWMAEHIPFPRRERPLPNFLTPEEMKLVLSAVENPKHLMMLEVIYGTGVRVSEMCSLKLADIDSRRQVITVRDGKGNKGRLTLLSSTLLVRLRKYWLQYKPKDWLFEGRRGPARPSVAQKACARAERDSGVGKKVTPHVIRHAFATALLEQGVDLVTISNLLGHSRIKTTELYTHVTLKKLQNTQSPLDTLECLE